jgi:membrane-associated phospholipid phosphatase
VKSDAPEAAEPILAPRAGRAWLRWLRHLSTRARDRLAGASLLLVSALAFAAFNLWLFGRLADEVMERETVAVDDAVYELLHRFASPALDRAARIASWMGSELVLILLVGLVVLLGWRGRWGAAGGLVLVAAGAQLLNDVLKATFQRTRPNPTTFLIPAQAFSFPSGHAMVSAAFYGYLAYLGWHLFRRRAVRIAWVLALVLLVLLIGLSRVYLGVHYVTDVVAGYAAGLVWTESVILAGRYLAARRTPTAPAPPAAVAPAAGRSGARPGGGRGQRRPRRGGRGRRG